MPDTLELMAELRLSASLRAFSYDASLLISEAVSLLVHACMHNVYIP